MTFVTYIVQIVKRPVCTLYTGHSEDSKQTYISCKPRDNLGEKGHISKSMLLSSLESSHGSLLTRPTESVELNEPFISGQAGLLP